MNKQQKKYFDIFKKECLKWVEFFGLKHTHITIGYTTNTELYFAASWPDHEAKVCEIKINLSSLDDTNIHFIKRAAFHEVCECLFSGVYFCAESRDYSEKLMNAEVHAIIRTLENTVFDKNK